MTKMNKKDEKYFENRDQQFYAMCDEGYEIFQTRNREYGDAISRTGVIGACVEIIGGAARVEALVLKAKELGGDNWEKLGSLKNVLHDLHNYANIALMMIEDNNWRGE